MANRVCHGLFLLLHVAVLFNSVGGAVDGSWSGWSGWSGCAPGICAGNQRIRTRTCTNPLPSDDGAYCPGDSAEGYDCMIDGDFSEWSQWSLCDNPCGGSIVNRSRSCSNPTPTDDGAPCAGDFFQTKLECISPCPTGPIDGDWASWSPWTQCSQTCGISGGTILRRSRLCNQPPPMNGGKSCVGNDTESANACFTPCPVDGGFGLWSAWSDCSQTCGTGTKSRSRVCTNPVPDYGGQNCTGDFDEALSCKITSCPGAIDGGWTTWSSYGACSEPTYCLRGSKVRTRTCTNPPAANYGDECGGLAEENVDCPTDAEGCQVYTPPRPDKVAAEPTSYTALECEATEKKSSTGSYQQEVPLAVYTEFSFMQSELLSGWFATLQEDDPDDPESVKKLTKVCFELVSTITIQKIVDNKASYYTRTSALPEWTIPEQTVNVPGITIWIDETQALRKYEFKIGVSDKYVPIGGFELTTVRFSYYTEGNSQTFKAKGDHTLTTGNVFKTEITKDVLTGGVYAKGKSDSATFADMMASYGVNSNVMPDFLIDALKGIGLWDFTMAPAELVRKVEKWGVNRFTATIDALGIPVHVEILTGIRFSRPTFAVGFAFDRESFGALSEKLSGIGVDFLDSLGVEIEIGISFSPPEITGIPQLYVDEETKFAKEPLHSFVVTTVYQGIFAAAQIVLPKDCSGNIFCEITKLIVGPTAKFYVYGEFQWKKVKVAAGFANIRIWGDYYFHKMELYVEADWNATATHIKLGFRVDIKIPVNGDVYRDGIKAPSNELFIFGVLEYDFTEQVVAGKLGMRGMWRKAFTIPWLALGNIFLGMTYKVGAPIPITGIQFGMRIEFGYDCLIPADFDNSGHCFGGAGYFGVGEPQFFYADMTALTLGKIIRLLGFTFSLPPPIAATGFPEGASGSYSTADVDLRIAGGPFIYKGFMLKGRVNILGWEIYAHIKLSDTTVFVDLKPDPVDILGIAKIQRSPTEPDVGPWFYLDSRSVPPFLETYIEGYTSLLGISVYCRLNLTMTQMELLIVGNFLNLITAEVFVTASYGLSFSGSHFYVRVTVDLSGINNALDEAAKAVKAAFDAAQQELANARKKVEEEKAECKRKMTLKCDNCKSLKCKQAEDDCKGFLDAAGKWISKTLSNVGKAFKKAFKGWRKKRELEQLRNQNFAVHLRRRRFVSKILCEGLVGGTCKGIAALCEGSCKFVEHIAKGLCNVLDVAIGFLRLTEMATNWVSKAINFVLTQLFRVHSIKIEFSLSSYAAGAFPNAVFTAAVDLTIFGKGLYLAVSFDLNDPIGSLRVGADTSTQWYKDKMNPQNPTEPENDYYDVPNPFADFDFSELFQIENQQSATDDRRGACLYVDGTSENSYIKVTGCNETDERQIWTYTLQGLLQNTYSKLCMDTNGAAQGSQLIQTTCDKRQDDQNFQCDLTVRTVKRRRADQCLTVGTTSLNGPGQLVHLGSLKCIHPNGGAEQPTDGTKLVIYAGCELSRLEFELDNGNLKHTTSGKCVQPIGAVVDGVQLGLYSSCGGHQFSFTTGGSLQHVGSRKCVNTRSGTMVPPNNDDIVLDSACENSDTSIYKEHLLFNFIPTNPYVTLDKCTNFDQARLDQRFEVADESVVSICSKYVRNLAARKSTEQSSTAYNGFSSRAVDENYSTIYEEKSCTHTKTETNPWWRVDLGREYIVTDVIIVNRFHYSERLTNFDVRVGVNTDNLENPTCHDRVGTVEAGKAVTVMCDPPIPGRYVSVQMFGSNKILTLCEVFVHSRVGAMADLCQLDNGGCVQVCYNLCNLKVKCGCWPGYTLAYDGTTCVDKDECLSNHGGCDIVNGQCINTPGSYFCGCNQGYDLKEDSEYECEDFNECQVANAGCEHVCNNTAGSFNCDCRAGFKLKADSYGCEDVDECATNQGGCEHTCTNYEGGYYCTCDVGYRLMDDDHGCEEIYCPALEAPFRGSITPTTCTDVRENIRRTTVCTYGCVSGHYLDGGNQALTCQIDGFWQGTVPYCKAVVCPKLTLPDQGAVVPSSCSLTDTEYGTRCVFYCSDGYALKGPRYTTCQADTTWSEIAALSCEKVYTDPWIACPISRAEELASDQSTVVLGYKWQLPRTNLHNVTVSPSNYDENYPFPVGKHQVTWFGTSDTGSQLSCSLYITVTDVTPPSVQGCPASFTDSTSLLSKEVTWVAPTFTDNVGVVSVLSNREPGFTMDAYTSINIQYTATDAAGNIVYCQFTITLEGPSCPPIASPKNGRSSNVGGIFLTLYCDPAFFFNPPPPGLPAIFRNPFYQCMNKKWVSRDDGVSILTESTDCMAYEQYTGSPCKGGSILYDTVICLNCPPGTYSDNNTNTCKECIAGFYQDVEGQQECQPCNKNYSTAITGSKNQSDCRPICRAGHYSTNNGVCPCKLCPIGTYQSFEQYTTCNACPVGTNTLTTGSTSIDDCQAPVGITSTVPDQESTVTEGGTFNLACYIEGIPTPSVTWLKPGGTPPTADRVVVNHFYDLDRKLSGIEYVISGTLLSDAGIYKCEASNAYSTVTKEVTVNVEPLPVVIAPPEGSGA